MEKTYDNFKVTLLSEIKGKDKIGFIFELRLTSENNCRIKITDFEVFDVEGNKYAAEAADISVNDVILGHSKFFTETKKVNAKISAMFKSKIGCMAVLTLICVEDKKKMNFCFQRKGTNRWDMVGIQFLEYIPETEVVIPVKEKKTYDLGAFEEAENVTHSSATEAPNRQTDAATSLSEQPETTEGGGKQQTVDVSDEVAATQEEQVEKEMVLPKRVRNVYAAGSFGMGASAFRKTINSSEKAATQAATEKQPVDRKSDTGLQNETAIAAQVLNRVEKQEQETLDKLEEELTKAENQSTASVYSGVQVVQSDEGVKIVPIENNPVKIMVKKYSLALLKQKIEVEGFDTYKDISMKKILMKYDVEKETLGSIATMFRDLLLEEYGESVREKVREEETERLKQEMQETADEYKTSEEKKPVVSELISNMVDNLLADTVPENDKEQVNPSPDTYSEAEHTESETVGEEKSQAEELEEYLNEIIDFDEKSAETIGLSLKNMNIRVEENKGKFVPVFYSEVSYSKETYVLVRCPIVKALFYDAKGGIMNMSMHSVSKIYTGEDVVQMEFKKNTYDYWKKNSRIKIMVTL